MKSILYIIIFTLAPKFIYCQTSTKIRKAIILPSAVSYIWQGTNNLNFGIQPMLLLNAKENHNNIGLVIAGNISLINNAAYLTPTTKIKLYRELKNRKIGYEISMGYFYTKLFSKFDHRIYPEIGIALSHFHLTYGYNFQISQHNDNVTNNNIIALRFGGW
jgi:hypothetical protein